MQLAQLIADRMGVTLEIIPMDFTDVLPAVADGTCDLAISALSYTPARASQYGLSKGYYFSDDDAGNVKAVSDYIRGELVKRFRGFKFVVYDTSDTSLDNGRKVTVAGQLSLPDV